MGPRPSLQQKALPQPNLCGNAMHLFCYRSEIMNEDHITYVATYAGTESVEGGSRQVVRVAFLGPDGPTGTFTRWENVTIPW